MSKRGVVLNGRAREIVCNVDKYFESEKQQSLELMQQLKAASILSGPEGNISVTREIYDNIFQTLQNACKVAERVHLATGINKNTLTRIRGEKRDAQVSCSKITTPIKKARGQHRTPMKLEPNKLYQLPQSELLELVQLHMEENTALRAENSELFSVRDQLLRDQELLSRENERLLKKLEDVNSVCVRSPIIAARPTYSGSNDTNIWTNPATSSASSIASREI